MKTLLLGFACLGITSCATMGGTPLPQEQREFTFVEKTDLKQADAYNAALLFISKKLGDSNMAIKMKDPGSGTIMTQIGLGCPELRGALDLMSHTPSYNLEIDAKDNKIRMVYEAYEDRIVNVGGEPLGAAFISSPSQVAAVKTCASRNKDELLHALSKKKASDNW